MEILATEAFLNRAKENPEPVKEYLQLVLSSPPPAGAPMATRLEDSRVLGWSVRERKIALWYMVDAQEALGDADQPALSSMSKAELRDLGVDEALIPRAQQVRSSSELDRLGLPDHVAQRLRFVLIQQANGLAASEDELRYSATDLGHLDRFLHGDITQLLLNLDPSQRQIVELGGHGPIIVRGVAGSGKTAVALHRIYGSLKQRSLLTAPRVLFLTYNRALSSVAKELLVSLGMRSDDVSVSTLHKWCVDHLPRRPRTLDHRTQRQLILEACAAVRATAGGGARESAIWSYPPAFWTEEIHRIKGNVLGGAEEYAQLYRYGAGRPLDQRLRSNVWLVHEAYLGLQKKRGLCDWDDVVRLAYDRLRAQGNAAPRYDHVLVDEAQDLTVMAMRVAAALSRPEGSLLVSYDPAQSIYERGFRWKSYGITVHGSRSFELYRNFRNTAEILAAAKPLLAGMKDTSDTGEQQAAEEVMEPEHAHRHGVAPRFVPVALGEECSTVAADIARLIEQERVPPQNIAVLCYPNRIRDRMFAALKRANILCQQHDDQSVIRVADTSVKVLPIKSAKGLEFPVVYVLATGANFKPPFDGEHEQAAWTEQMGRCFYMALTRAMSRLIIVYARQDPVSFLRPILAATKAKVSVAMTASSPE
ncbi:MAG: DEAD/DEAH box helicase [Deltaproteobacteria bacterium]|nr:DEAD/DEAH box helicase [Deltaproteobacteria bacterium]